MDLTIGKAPVDLYGSAKHALNCWCRRVAAKPQWDAAGIPLNVVAPRVIDTPAAAWILSDPDTRAQMERMTSDGYCSNLAFRRGAAKSRNARSLIGRNRPATYTRLTGQAGGSKSSSKVVSVPASRASSMRWKAAGVIPMPARAASHAASALLTTSRECTRTARLVLSLGNVQTSGKSRAV
jgi:NAD(P)-dependent dehydrogenase (short-subunit alcohol dehydrogenase family)